MSVFYTALSRLLKSRIPMNHEYEWSRRIPGALVPREEAKAIDHVTIIIDSELTKQAAKTILDDLIRFITQDFNYKKSRYRLFLWNNEQLVMKSRLNTQARFIEKAVETIDEYTTKSGNWMNFKEIYQPHKKAGEVILITSEDKVKQLEQLPRFIARNLVILYEAYQEELIKRKIFEIPSLGYRKREEEDIV